MKIQGKIKHVSEVQEGTTKDGSEWAKRTIVITEDVEQFPNELVANLFKKGEHIEYAKDKFTFAVGDLVEVEYSTRANEYKGKWYGDNSIFKIEKAQTTPQAEEEDQDSLPF